MMVFLPASTVRGRRPVRDVKSGPCAEGVWRWPMAMAVISSGMLSLLLEGRSRQKMYAEI